MGGVAVTGNPALRTSADASRTVAGTCADCADGSYSATATGACVAQTIKGTCTGKLLAVGNAAAVDRFTPATPTKNSQCEPCAAGSYGKADGSVDCLAQPVCGNQLATTGALCAAVSRGTGTDSVTTVGTCAPCSDNTFAPDDATSCLANAVCGANRVDVVATRKLIGTCKDCLANTWALLKSEACIANTVCGVAVTGNPALRTSADASRNVAGTCANCAGGSWGTATGDCTACAVVANAVDGATYTCSSATTSRVSACKTNFWKDTSGVADVCKAVNTGITCGKTTAGGSTARGSVGATATADATCAGCAGGLFAASATADCACTVVSGAVT